MKYLLVALLVLAATTHAALVDWNIGVSVNDDGSSDWTAILTYNGTVAKSDYFMLSTLYNVETFADNQSVPCDVKEDIGTSIVCNNIRAQTLTYKFHTKKFVDNIQNLKIFRYGFSATQTVDKIHITVGMPLGTALVEQEKLTGTGLTPFDPDFGRQTTDGRRIFVTWTFDKPLLGQPISISAIYENIGFDPFTLFVIILVLIVIVFIAFLAFFTKRHKVRDILPMLTDGERKLMEILLREHGEVDQRILVKETDFSKAKVSRIISDLMARGILDKVSRGRKNLIKLKKEVKQPESKPVKLKEEK
ncbi:MAG TPA: hypothetical protein VJI12_02980 [archaeon]|nr:hypothetical protein [archaeon]